MNASKDVVACFVLYEQDEIVLQCSFDVEEDIGVNRFHANDGTEFVFTHSYEHTTCSIKITREDRGAFCKSLKLDFPINRSKIKWKQADFGDRYVLYYRSQFEPGAY